MAQVTGILGPKMLEYYNADIVNASLSGDNLILTTRGGTPINVGSVRGANALMTGTATQLAAVNSSVAAVAPDAIAGQTFKIGDLIISRHAASNGTYGRITALASQISVTVQSLGTLVGPAGATYTPPALVRAKMVKTTDGYNAAGSSNVGNAWAKLSGFTTTAYADNFAGVSLANGELTIPSAGYYDIVLTGRVPSCTGNRAFNIIKGTASPDTGSVNTIGAMNFEPATGISVTQTVALDVQLAANDVLSFWVRIGSAVLINTTNGAVPGWTNVQIVKRA